MRHGLHPATGATQGLTKVHRHPGQDAWARADAFGDGRERMEMASAGFRQQG